METDRAKDIIVEILQNALKGNLIFDNDFNPQFVADAIAKKVDFGKSYVGLINDKVASVLIDEIVSKRSEMKKELAGVESHETNLFNFIKGKITAYNEILEILNKL